MSTNHFCQVWEPLELRFDPVHRLLGQLHARLLRGGHQLYNRMDTVPCHGTGKRQDRLNGGKERPIPVVFQEAPAALDRMVLPRGRRVRGQPYTSMRTGAHTATSRCIHWVRRRCVAGP